MNNQILFGTIAILMAFITGIGASALANSPEAITAIPAEGVQAIERAVEETLEVIKPKEELPQEDNKNSLSDDDIEDEEEDDEEDRPRSSGPASAGTPSASQPKSSNKSFSMTDVASHGSEASCYIVVGTTVYDVTTFISKHPGGAFRILPLCGRDATSAFTEQHAGEQKPQAMLSGFEIGVLK